MFPRSLRLSRTGFEQTRGLRRMASPHFGIAYGTNDQVSGLAVVVPKKVVKSAVARHLLKRRVRAVLRSWSAKDRVIIITARSGANTLSFSNIESELSAALTDILAK